MIYVLMLVVALAFGGFVWQLYSAPTCRASPPQPGPYKIEPPLAGWCPMLASKAVRRTATAKPTPPLRPNAAEAARRKPVRRKRRARASRRRPLRGAIGGACNRKRRWSRRGGASAARAPALFAPARLDVQRADLGARGIYYRVRAGYFADRANAARFCDRIREMGQDCIPAAR